MLLELYGGFPTLGVPFWGPQNKDYSILGSTLGSTHFSESTKCTKQHS